MNSTQLIHGPAGVIELKIESPEGLEFPTRVVVVAHPHPLFGGTMNNKVVQTIVRAFVLAGWCAVRFNFRGVGRSEGVYDHGVGEEKDMRAVIQHVLQPGQVLALAGFSFGAYVAARVAAFSEEDISPVAMVLVGVATERFPVPLIPEVLRQSTTLVHGELDETVALSSVFDWARPQGLPVSVVPGSSHFFHGYLPTLKNLVLRNISC